MLPASPTLEGGNKVNACSFLISLLVGTWTYYNDNKFGVHGCKTAKLPLIEVAIEVVLSSSNSRKTMILSVFCDIATVATPAHTYHLV